jgi:hypothetical protein
MLVSGASDDDVADKPLREVGRLVNVTAAAADERKDR